MGNGYNKEAVNLLADGSLKAIPFNVILASLLLAILVYNQVPLPLTLGWFVAIVVISLIRWVFCTKLATKKIAEETIPIRLKQFFFLTLLMGMVWGSCYPISLPYLTELNEFIVILVFGGMCAGAIASLSIYLPAYYAYILPMFLPVIVYNYSTLNIDRMVLATMFTLFIVMLIISAKVNSKLLKENIALSHEKDSLVHKLELISITDPLTSLYNRRYFNAIFPKEFNRAKRSKYALNLILMDVDNFKLINDTLGHPTGDKLLGSLAKLLKSKLRRASDIIFRLGGDEFAAIVINKTAKEAESLCHAINDQFKKDMQRNKEAKKGLIADKISLSMGVLNIGPSYLTNLKDIIIQVDKALYEAKKQGKNQIIVKKID
jgi:diguanylate cyclase (GGDEF)-like protein